MKYILYITLLFVGFTSCEKVIDLPLNEADQKVVIEAVTSDFVGDSYVLISITGTVYEQSVFEKINNAVVTVTDKNGVITIFSEDGTNTGKYVNAGFLVTENNNYLLNVQIGVDEYTSKYSTQTRAVLDFIYSEKIGHASFGGNAADSSNVVYFAFTDNVNETNYYRFKVFKNGDYTNELYLGDDKLINGEQFVNVFFGDEFDSGDTVLVEMQNIDKANYTYFYSMSNAQSDNPFSATPANPVSNIDGGALGYYGAYLKDTMNLIVP